MGPLRPFVALAVVLAVSGPGRAQTLSTSTTSNNGTGGVFLMLTPTAGPLQVTGLNTQFAGTVGLAINIQVYTRPGAYAGFTTSNVGWTLNQTATATAAGTTTNTPVTLTVPIDIPAGDATSIYLHSVTSGGGIRYFGTGTTSTTTYSNADVTMFTNIARTGAVAFAGTQNTPRAFVGDVVYAPAPVPEPAFGLAAVATVGVWFIRRRAAARPGL